jgi:hypothetical protein
MTARPQWKHCIANYGDEAIAFANTYFAEPQRRCLFVGGAGFDPRCVTFASILTTHLGDRLQAIFLRERRPEPSAELVSRAEKNIEALGKTVGAVEVIDIDVLAEEDGAVIGGRRATEALIGVPLDSFTDIVLDLSALSVGISFPVARLLLERANQATPKKNFHLVVVSNAGLDDAINSVPSDFVDPVHGFSGRLDLEGSAQEPKIWMPALAVGKARALQTLREKLRGPVVVCPILPLSQRDPRASDKLVAEFESELYQSWEVDSDNVIYAIEDDPLDLYLIISAIYTRYTRVFANVTNSHVVLTPSGSKTLAIGALMAAVEHDLAVRYVEAVSYEVKWDRVDGAQSAASMPIHVWLSGDAYEAASAPVPPGHSQ